jgi:exodeoxyribonuclease-3
VVRTPIMKSTTLYSWNVNGLRAAQRHGFEEWLMQTQPDILCLQETKAHPGQLSESLREPDEYQTFWSSAERKGYSGVSLYTRMEPSRVTYGLGEEAFDREGRTIQADFEDFVLITTYVPNGSRDLSRVPFKMAFKKRLLETCNRLVEQSRSVILCGDINTSHREIDLARPRQNATHTGFLPEERAWIDELLSNGYIDTFRTLHPEAQVYSWWAYWGGARERNVGWRLDYFFVSPDLMPHVTAAEIHIDVLGSDHCPVSLTLNL